MGGQIDWSALPVVVEMYGIDDVELLLAELCAIRAHNHLAKQKS